MNYLIEGNNIGEALKKLPLLQSGHSKFLFEKEKTVGIDHIRQLKKDIGLKRALAQTLVIKQAGRFTVPAQNAFLKLLGEPPHNISFILITNNRQDLLPTIVSRCCLIKLKGDAVTTANEATLKKATLFLQAIQSFAKACEYKNGIKKELKEEEIALEYLAIWQAILRDSLLLKIGEGGGITFKKIKEDTYKTFAPASIADIKKIVKMGNEYYYWIQNTNINPDKIAGVFLNLVAFVCTKKKI
ncbi:MAG: hypothetical protein ABH814_01975 [bacterium]